jgi:hypothetical protein
MRLKTDGSDKSQLVPGSLWTIGPNKRMRDFAWTGDVWEIISVRGPTVFLRNRNPKPRWYGSIIDVQFSDHDWFPAEALLEELERHVREVELESGEGVPKAHAEADQQTS